MAQHITGFPGFRAARHHDERIVGIVFGGGHGQTDDQGSPLIESAWREHHEGVRVAHLATRLGLQSIQITSWRSGTQGFATATTARLGHNRHHLTAVARGIKTGETLFQGRRRIFRGVNHPPVFHAHPHPLIGVQMRLARHGRRQTHPVAPVLDIQYRLAYGSAP